MKEFRYWMVDAFASKPFEGNPAAVMVIDQFFPDEQLQLIAREFNLSETAFAVSRGEGSYDLRWFTPSGEVELCGHATLATASVLWTEGFVPQDRSIHFATKSGLLVCHRDGQGVLMDFPAIQYQDAGRTPAALKLKDMFPAAAFIGVGSWDHVVVLPDEQAVRDVVTTGLALREVGGRGIIVTAAATMPGVDFVSRAFFPMIGIDEDPVTGSAHCLLATYWARRLGKTKLTGRQVSARGGTVTMRLVDGRCWLGGTAVLVAKGVLL